MKVHTDIHNKTDATNMTMSLGEFEGACEFTIWIFTKGTKAPLNESFQMEPSHMEGLRIEG